MSDFPSYETLVAIVNEILEKSPVDPRTGEKETFTLRQLYYKLVVLKVFENTKNNYKMLSARLVTAREKGDVDDKRIEDRARKVVGGDISFRSPGQFYQDHESAFRNSWKDFSRPFWLDQEFYVEVAVEKDSLSGPVSAAASEYNVVTCVNRGYASYSYLHDAAARIQRACSRYHPDPTLLRTPVILYLGDHDPSGVDMVRDLEERLRKYGLGYLPADYHLVRKIGVNQEQIQEYGLPTIPLTAKKTKDDKRSKKFVQDHGVETVELDVFDNEFLKKLVSAWIEAHINREVWDRHQNAAKEERELLHQRIEDHFGGRS